VRVDGVLQLLDLVRVLVAKELKLRYRGTTLGVFWSLANPLAFALVLYVAFRRVFRVEIDAYPLFILSALFPWQWLSNSWTSASGVFVYNAALIKKVRFPRFALCLAVVVSDLLHFLASVPVFALLALAFNGLPPLGVWALGVPLMLVAQTGLTVAGVLVIASVNAYVRDLEQLVRVFLLLLFYVTPILFPLAMVPENLRWLVVANPLAPLAIGWRAVLFEGAVTPYVGIALLWALVALAVAVPIYRRLEWRLAEVV
jgi:lipopolysaccharide transport system permease protein